MRRVIFDSLCPSPAFSPFSWSLGSHVLGGGDDQLSCGFIRMHVRCEPVIPLLLLWDLFFWSINTQILTVTPLEDPHLLFPSSLWT